MQRQLVLNMYGIEVENFSPRRETGREHTFFPQKKIWIGYCYNQKKINKIKINTNANSESGLQNDIKYNNNNNINQITIISQS